MRREKLRVIPRKTGRADVIGLLDALNAEKCVLVGNDWGRGLAWADAQLYPELIATMFHLNIAYAPRGDEPPTASIAKFAEGILTSRCIFKSRALPKRNLKKMSRLRFAAFFTPFRAKRRPA